MGQEGTPPEEVARQYAEAQRLVDDRLACAVPPSTAEIPRSMKLKPSIELLAPPTPANCVEEEKKGRDSDEEQSHPVAQRIPVDESQIVVWSSRGYIDVKPLQHLVREGYRISDHYSPDDDQSVSSNNDNGDKKSNNDKTREQQQPSKPSRKKRLFSAADVRSDTNLWDQANAAVHNVAICRPSHDAWGIGKIVLVFADDFLQDVYDLPWWHMRADIRNAVKPMLDTLDISHRQIVRLLLASLPPGTTIPVHHDSGAWVTQTHRVHLPVIAENPEQIMFRVGTTDETLQRIDCTPGHVFEINNQCRHAVSNCSNDYRVHLILDYVDGEPNEHIPLDPGERLFQTRRSIDRLKDQGTRPCPSFLILGAQKAGTTSLYECMMQHPLIVKPKRRETHCLDWRWKEDLPQFRGKTFNTEQLRAHCHLFYHYPELRQHPSCATGDSTPSYLLDSRRVVPRLKRVFDADRMQFLVVTRDPLARAESHFTMVTSTDGTLQQLQTRGMEWRNKSFQQVVRDEWHDMQQCGLIPYWDASTGTVDDANWLEFVDTPQEDEAWDLYLKNHVKLNTGSYGLLARGLYALQLRPWFMAFRKEQFLVLSLEDDLNPSSIHSTMERVWKHVQVPASFRIADDAPQNTRIYNKCKHREEDAELYQALERFFVPHQRRFEKLYQELQQDGRS